MSKTYVKNIWFCLLLYLFNFTYDEKDFGKNEEESTTWHSGPIKKEKKMLIDRTGNWLTRIHDSFGSRYGWPYISNFSREAKFKPLRESLSRGDHATGIDPRQLSQLSVRGSGNQYRDSVNGAFFSSRWQIRSWPMHFRRRKIYHGNYRITKL